MVNSKRELAKLLSRAPPFPKPSRVLEQYVTDGETASELLWQAYMRGDIEGRIVLDLGCGTGVFALGSVVLGASMAICVEIDLGALIRALRWLETADPCRCVEPVQASVPDIWLRRIDTVIMNPPFGVYRRHADTLFLEAALSMRPRAVYTIHKSGEGTLSVVERISRAAGYELQVLGTRRLMIPQLFEEHRRRVYRVTVDLYRIVKVSPS